MNAEILVRIVSWRQRNKPVEWIAREEGVDVKDVRVLLRIAGDPHWRNQEIALDKYDRIEYLVSQRASLSEIVRTTGSDNRTIKRWFPDAGWAPGSQERKDAVAMGRKMTELERGRLP